MKPWMLWVLAIAAAWVLWRLYRRIRQAALEAPLREAAQIADELMRGRDVREMVATYQGGDPACRLGAVLALAGLESDAALQPLVAALEDENLEVRLIALKALAKIPRKDALQALIDRGLQDPSTLARTSVLRSLGERGDAEAVPPVARVLKNALSNPVLCARELQVGARALALLGDMRGMWVLKDAQQCEVKRVREAARQAQAIIELRARLERDPQDAAAARDLGAHYIAATEFERAREALARAVELDPGDANARKALGAVHEALEQPDLAIAQYQEAGRLVPDDAVTQVALGDALARQGRVDEARRAYERFLELQPEGAQARRVRAAMRKMA